MRSAATFSTREPRPAIPCAGDPTSNGSGSGTERGGAIAYASLRRRCRGKIADRLSRKGIGSVEAQPEAISLDATTVKRRIRSVSSVADRHALSISVRRTASGVSSTIHSESAGALLAAITMAFPIRLSRVLPVGYRPSDVLDGSLVGGLWLVAASAVAGMPHDRGRAPAPVGPDREWTAIASLTIAVIGTPGLASTQTDAVNPPPAAITADPGARGAKTDTLLGVSRGPVETSPDGRRLQARFWQVRSADDGPPIFVGSCCGRIRSAGWTTI